jgi:hypothetical protein
MLDTELINETIREIAAANLGSGTVDHVLSEPTADSQGNDALRITIVIKPSAASSLVGNALLDTLLQIQTTLSEKGEERFPIVEYATTEELAVSDEDQS